MARALLTDRYVRGLQKKPAAKGAHYDVMDTVVPGLGIRVSDTGYCAFVLITRFPGQTNATRRAIGKCGAITLEGARVKARQWLELISQGKDPALVEERARAAELRRQGNTFAAVAEDFIKTKLPREAKGAEVERDIRRIFIAQWGHRPITDILYSGGARICAISCGHLGNVTAPVLCRQYLFGSCLGAGPCFSWRVTWYGACFPGQARLIARPRSVANLSVRKRLGFTPQENDQVQPGAEDDRR